MDSTPSKSHKSYKSKTLKDYMLDINDKKEEIEKLSNETICDMIGHLPDRIIENSLGNFNKMDEQGENSIVYSLKDKGISLKIMKNNIANKRELDFYMYFSENYLNFPVVYKDVECVACNLENDNKEDCMVVLSELYDGSLNSTKRQLSKEQILSMIVQVSYACSILEQHELVHGDLHSGNILYRNVEDNDVIPIEIGDKIYNIKTFGKLWVLWDFGNMTYTGEMINNVNIKAIDTLHTDLNKLFVLINKSYINDLLHGDKNIKNTHQLIKYLLGKYPNLY
jgi:hypothetical protein